MRMRATWSLICSKAVSAARALSLIVVVMCRATLDGVSNRRWAISSRIVPSRSWPMPVKTGTVHRQTSRASSRSLSQARSVTEPPPRMTTRASNGPLAVGGEGLVDGGADRGRGVHALEGRPEVEELAEPGVVEPIGLTPEVAQARRGLGADDGDPDELVGRWEAPVPLVEAILDQPLPDAGQLGGEVAEGVAKGPRPR